MARLIGPMPDIRKTRPSPLTRILKGRHSSLDVLFERSYSMKMGEFSGLRRKYYFLAQPDLVDKVLSADVDLYPKSNLMGTILYQILGDGIFVSTGDTWRRQRRMMNPAFILSESDSTFTARSLAFDVCQSNTSTG